jgi:hypothetical protein
MDTNTGEIKVFTPEQVAAEIAKAKGLQLPIKPDESGAIKRDPNEQRMSTDEIMGKFFPTFVPLKRLPKKNCKRCHGLGNLGKNLTTGKYVPCSCTQ